jgi:hypothetical protein
MAETEVVRQFLCDVADHVEGIKPLPDPKSAAELLRMFANSEPAPDGGWKEPKGEKDETDH